MDDQIVTVLVKIGDGEPVKIRDLDRSDYEAFLEMMHRLRIAYIAATR